MGGGGSGCDDCDHHGVCVVDGAGDLGGGGDYGGGCAGWDSELANVAEILWTVYRGLIADEQFFRQEEHG